MDVGCARGDVGAGLKQHYGEHVFVWGIELNQQSAAVSATRLDKVSTVPLEKLNEEDLALLKTIDTVLLYDVLEHMYDPWGALVVLSQHLSPDAQIIVSLPNAMNINIMRDLVKGYWHYHASGLLDVTHIRFFTPYEMKKMFYETGFRSEFETCSLWGGTEQTHAAHTGPFPLWLELDGLKIEVTDYNHWVYLHSVQVFARYRVASDDALRPDEIALRHEPHPPTHIIPL